MVLEQQWWTSRGVEADLLWSNNVAFMSQYLEDPFLASVETRRVEAEERRALTDLADGAQTSEATVAESE